MSSPSSICDDAETGQKRHRDGRRKRCSLAIPARLVEDELILDRALGSVKCSLGFMLLPPSQTPPLLPCLRRKRLARLLLRRLARLVPPTVARAARLRAARAAEAAAGGRPTEASQERRLERVMLREHVSRQDHQGHVMEGCEPSATGAQWVKGALPRRCGAELAVWQSRQEPSMPTPCRSNDARAPLAEAVLIKSECECFGPR